jgi:hypothetical protein
VDKGDLNMSQARSTPNLLVRVATDLQPKEPPPVPTKDESAESETEDTVAEPTGPEEFAPGPLDEAGWQYVGYMLRPDPLKSLVVLKKGEDVPSTVIRGSTTLGRGSSRLTTRRPPIRGRTTNRPGVRSPLRTQARDRVSFLVGDRVFQDETLELDFMIHSADENRFVYWEPGKPGTFYALTYQQRSTYFKSPEKGLRPPPEPEEEGEDAAEEEKKMFVRVPREFEDRREEEYEQMLEGGAPGAAMQAIRGESGNFSAATGDGAGASPGVRPRPPTAEEREELKNTLREIAPRMNTEQKATMQKALRNIPKAQ